MRCSEQSSIIEDSISVKAAEGEAGEAEEPKEDGATPQEPDDAESKVEGTPESTEPTVYGDDNGDSDEGNVPEKLNTEEKAGEAADTTDAVTPGDGKATKGDDVPNADGTVPSRESEADAPPLVVTEIAVVTFSEGEKVCTSENTADQICDTLRNSQVSHSKDRIKNHFAQDRHVYRLTTGW